MTKSEQIVCAGKKEKDVSIYPPFFATVFATYRGRRKGPPEVSITLARVTVRADSLFVVAPRWEVLPVFVHFDLRLGGYLLNLKKLNCKSSMLPTFSR